MFDEAKEQIMASSTPSNGINLSGMAIDFDHYLIDRCPALEAGAITTASAPAAYSSPAAPHEPMPAQASWPKRF